MVCKPEISAFACSNGPEGLRLTLVNSEGLYPISTVTYPCQPSPCPQRAGEPHRGPRAGIRAFDSCRGTSRIAQAEPPIHGREYTMPDDRRRQSQRPEIRPQSHGEDHQSPEGKSCLQGMEDPQSGLSARIRARPRTSRHAARSRGSSAPSRPHRGRRRRKSRDTRLLGPYRPRTGKCPAAGPEGLSVAPAQELEHVPSRGLGGSIRPTLPRAPTVPRAPHARLNSAHTSASGNPKQRRQ